MATTPRSATRSVTSPAASAMTRIIRSEAAFLRSGWLAAFLLLVVLLTWMKTLAVCCPVIFGDEALYSLLSKFSWREHAAQHNELIIDLPNYLYFRVYRLAFIFGDDFLAGAKLLNSIFIAGAFFPVYALCRIFLARATSFALAALAVLGPFSLYATFFMPEAMYFFGFWLYAYVSFRFLSAPIVAQACIAGLVLGALVLVKPHAVALIPCSAIVYAVLGWRKKEARNSVMRILAVWVALLASVSVVRIVGAYLLTGQIELSFSGEAYGALLVGRSSRLAETLAHIPDYLKMARGHA